MTECCRSAGRRAENTLGEKDMNKATNVVGPAPETGRRSPRGRHVYLGSRRKKKQEYVLQERKMPGWHPWIGVVPMAAVGVITCVNRADEYGASAWAANGVVMLICITGVGTVTYFCKDWVAKATMVGTIVLGSLPMAALTHVIPPLEAAFSSLWGGSLAGMIIGFILTAGQRR